MQEEQQKWQNYHQRPRQNLYFSHFILPSGSNNSLLWFYKSYLHSQHHTFLEIFSFEVNLCFVHLTQLFVVSNWGLGNGLCPHKWFMSWENLSYIYFMLGLQVIVFIWFSVPDYCIFKLYFSQRIQSHILYVSI